MFRTATTKATEVRNAVPSTSAWVLGSSFTAAGRTKMPPPQCRPDRGISQPLDRSDVEPGVLEIEVPFEPVHDAIVDHPIPPQAHDGAALGLEQLAAEPLVVGRPFLDRAVAFAVEPGREPIAT